jgi:hypothetical protein
MPKLSAKEFVRGSSDAQLIILLANAMEIRQMRDQLVPADDLEIPRWAGRRTVAAARSEMSEELPQLFSTSALHESSSAKFTTNGGYVGH